MKLQTITAIATLGVFAFEADAVTVISSALTGAEVGSGQGGAFPSNSTGFTSGGTVSGVTTTIQSLTPVDPLGSNNWAIGSSPTWRYRAVDAANGLDVTYDVTATAFRFDASAGSEIEQRGRANGGFIRTFSINNGDRDEHNIWTTGNEAGDYEILAITATLVSSDGTTPYNLDGFASLNVLNTFGFRVDDVNNANADIGSGGTPGGTTNVGTILEPLDAVTDSIRYVATAGVNGNNSNRLNGFTVQFSEIPEPGSLGLLGVACLLGGLRRRR